MSDPSVLGAAAGPVPTALLLTATGFAATNLDNLALLVVWLAAARGRAGPLIVGYLVGMAVLLSLAVAFGLGAGWIPLDRIGLLGVVPIALGLKRLYGLVRRRPAVDASTGSLGSPGLALSVAATQLAHGLDTLLLFGPLLADSNDPTDRVVIVGFVGMSLVWLALARALERRLAGLRAFERYGEAIAAAVLIGVGVYILNDTATDVDPGP